MASCKQTTKTRIEDADKPRKPLKRQSAVEKTPTPTHSTRDLPKVTLKVYTTAGTHKWDQLAGFEHYAKAQGLKFLTMPEWEQALSDFMTKPVK